MAMQCGVSLLVGYMSGAAVAGCPGRCDEAAEPGDKIKETTAY